MIFMENTNFECTNTNVDVRVTSGDVFLTDWMELDTMPVTPPRGIARVLAPQGVPAESDIDSMRVSQRLHPGNIE